MAKNYVPARDADFDGWFTFLNQYVTEKCGAEPPAWNHIPQAPRTELLNACTAWHAGYTLTLKPCTSQERAEKRRLRKAAEQVIRPFVNQYLRYLPVTEEDRDNMGIPNHDSIPTPVPEPENQVEADLVFPGIHLVELQKIRPVSGTAPDNRSDYGVRIYYGLSGEPTETYRFRVTGEPKSGKDLAYSLFTKRKKERFDFDGESGNRVYFSLRYENSKGKAGHCQQVSKWHDSLQSTV